jgi:hypothetical protein
MKLCHSGEQRNEVRLEMNFPGAQKIKGPARSRAFVKLQFNLKN